MKVISLNVALFESNNDAVTAFLKEEQPDIVCLQEVTRAVDASVKPEFVSYDSIRETLPKLTHTFYAPITVFSKFDKDDFHGEKEFRFDIGGYTEFGQFFAGKYPITHATNIFVQTHFTYVTHHKDWPERDSRAVQVVDVIINDTQVRFLNYHGIWSRNKQGNAKAEQACRTIAELASQKEHAIICGDFNLFPDTPAIQQISRHFTSLVDEYEIKTTRPKSNELSKLKRNVVDYIFVSKAIQVKKFKVPNLDVSDHLPLILEFDL